MLSEKVNAQPDNALSSVSAAWFFSGAIMVLFALSFYILGVTSIVSKLILKSWLPSPLFLNISLVLGIWTAVQIMRRTILKRFPAGRYKMTRNEIMSLVAAVVLMISISLVIAKFTGEKLFSAVYGFNNSYPLQLFLIAVSLSLYVSVVCIMLKSYKSLYATIFSIIICVYLFYSYAEDGWKAYGVLNCFIFPSMIMINALVSMKQFKKTYPINGTQDQGAKS